MLEVINLNGETILKSKYSDIKSDNQEIFTRLPRGVYFVRVQKKNCKLKFKLCVS